VVVDGELPAGWRDSVDVLRARVAEMRPGECVPTHLAVETRHGTFWIVATARDGRRAERPVRRPDDLVPVALGLIAGIPPTPGPPSAPPPPQSPSSPEAPPVPIAPPPPPPEPPRPEPTVWLGLDAGVRLTAPRGFTVLDVEVRGDLVRGPWVFFGTLRSAVLSCLGEQGVDCDVYNDLGAGVGVARRLLAAAAAIDLGLEPWVAWTHMEIDGSTEANSVSGGNVELRIDASSRLTVPVSDSTNLTVSLDVGVSPSLLVSPAQLPSSAAVPTVPPFPPVWGGVRLGFSRGLF
jgi:hypothetical protein